MATTELEEVQALLDRALPDPVGFAQRLLMQVMARWGDSPEPHLTARYAHSDDPRDGGAGRTIVAPDQPPAPAVEVDTNLLLAAALGACECWGLRSDCHVCVGEGTTGWILPDSELFEELVRPAVARLSDESPSVMPDAPPEQDSNDRPTTEEWPDE